MKNVINYLSIFLSFLFIASCTNEEEKDANNTVPSDSIIYDTITCNYTDVLIDSSFEWENQIYRIKVSGNCREDVVSNEDWTRTLDNGQKVKVYYKNLELDIEMLFGDKAFNKRLDKTIFIDSLGLENVNKSLLGYTEVTAFYPQDTSFYMRSFIGIPDSDNGVSINYKVGYKGDVIVMDVECEEEEMGE